MKFRCKCQCVIADQTDSLPNKAYLVADQDWSDFLEFADLDQQLDLSFARCCYQCRECGRIFIEDSSGNLISYLPEDSDSPILGSIKGITKSNPDPASNRDKPTDASPYFEPFQPKSANPLIPYYAYWGEYFGYKFSISPEIESATPQWHQQEDFPPLSPRVAIDNSRLMVQRLLYEIQPFEPKFNACLLKAIKGENCDFWHYVVSWFVPDLEDFAADWSEFSVPVLFDGSIPEPTKFKYQDRFGACKSSLTET